jgi:succinate dehydrogenase flavin-adding protein (antitoxin of CptAB toxin-antitoxin module)
MAILTKSILEDIGIELSESDYRSLAKHFDTTLQERIFNEIAKELTDEQTEELAGLKNSPDEQIALWLTTNIPAPTLKEIVDDEVSILLGELAENSKDI